MTREIVIHSPTDERSPWGLVLRELLAVFKRDGYEVKLRPKKKQAPCPPIFRDYMVTGYRANPWELMLGPANHMPTPRKKTVWYTQWQESLNPVLAVRLLNMAEQIVVPSKWDRNRMVKAGVEKPITVIPFGFSEQIFNRHRPMPQKVIFGTTLNDNFHLIHGNFSNAFGNIHDVELWVRVHDDKTVPVDTDPRVKYFHGNDLKHWNRMENWYKALTCYVTLKPDGMGLSVIQAMACGVPVMGNAVGTKTEFLNESTGYPIIPETSLSGVQQAMLCGHFRRVYIERQAAYQRGVEGSFLVRDWDKAYIHLWHTLKEWGVL